MARFHGVGGAVSGTAPTAASGSRWRDTRVPTVLSGGARAAGQGQPRGGPATSTAWSTSSRSEGIGSGSRGSGGSISRPPGLEVEQVHHQLGAGHAVDRAVVHLGDHADVAVGQALHDVAAPTADGCGRAACWRSGRPPRPARRCPPGLGAADAADVVVEVEVRVLDPDRVVEPERHLDDAAPERRHEVQPRLDELLDLLELVAARASSTGRRSPSSPRACACSASRSRGRRRRGRRVVPRPR